MYKAIGLLIVVLGVNHPVFAKTCVDGQAWYPVTGYEILAPRYMTFNIVVEPYDNDQKLVSFHADLNVGLNLRTYVGSVLGACQTDRDTDNRLNLAGHVNLHNKENSFGGLGHAIKDDNRLYIVDLRNTSEIPQQLQIAMADCKRKQQEAIAQNKSLIVLYEDVNSQIQICHVGR